MPIKTLVNPRLYCPNQTCPNHQIPKNSYQAKRRRLEFCKKGVFYRKNRRAVQRYKCKNCQCNFSSGMTSLDYRNQRRGLNQRLYTMFIDGLSNRQIAARLGVDETLVRNRLYKLAQQSLLNQSDRTRYAKIAEVVAYDGVENFAKSQYEPNYINQAIGQASLFIYEFNFSALNRKGRRSDRQKLVQEKLDRSLGRFSPNAVQISTEKLFLRLESRCSSTLRPMPICCDRHFQYERARAVLRQKGVHVHLHKISAQAPRTFKHILFAVNHADLLLRQHVKAFARETISFSKTHAAMVRKYALFMVWKNYMRPQFTKRHKANPKSNIQSPAMAAGLERKILRFRDFFAVRKVATQVQLNPEWLDYYHGVVRNLRKGAELGAVCAAH